MAEVRLTVGAAAAVDAERVGRLTGQLRGDLREVPGLLVRRAEAADVPPDTRTGAALQLGTLVVSGVFSAATVKAVLDVVLRRLDRSAVTEATVTWQVGDRHGTVTASGTGVPAEQLVALAAAWANGGTPQGSRPEAAAALEDGAGENGAGEDGTAGNGSAEGAGNGTPGEGASGTSPHRTREDASGGDAPSGPADRAADRD